MLFKKPASLVVSAFPFIAVLAFFFVSGACGLLYQVVWTRQFVLLFGAASYAVSTVLSVFFLGLGAGSLLGGRLADRVRRPLFVYGAFEIIIGLSALALIVLLRQGEAAVVEILRFSAGSRAMAIGLRALLALVFLIVPVTLMGATLPLLARFVAHESRRYAIRIGALYTLNTLGAVAGCALTGFVLIAHFGYTKTLWLGAAGNIGVGLAAMALDRLRGARDVVAAGAYGSEDQSAAAIFPAARPEVLLAAFALSGFCALALEVLWTRLLVIVFLGTTYAFTTMLATLLFGIAAGSAAASALAGRRWNASLALGLVEILFGLSCLAMLPLFADLPERLRQFQFASGYHWEQLVRAKFFLSASVLVIPSFFSGMTFPLAVRAFSAGRACLGEDVGALYGANTFGGVVGALTGGYVLIPLLGTHHGIVVLSWLLFAAGLAIIVSTPLRWHMVKAALAVCCVALMAGAQAYLAPGDVCQALNAGYVPASDTIHYYREGVEATVLVSEAKDARPGSDRTLWINAVQATATIEKGVKMNRLQGVLPMLFDRDPKRVLFMCFGSGITAGTLSLWDFDRIDAVEISRDVLQAAPQFAADNFNVAENPSVRFTIDDGRNFLLTTPNRYDVITFEPMPLALAGVSTFYTREYYELCLDRLAPGGLVSQWVPLHSLNTDVVRSLVYTFTEAFPEYCAFFVNADLFLIGSNEPLRIDYPRVVERLNRPTIAAALYAVGLSDVEEVLTSFFMGKSHIDAYARGGQTMTDDCPWAEFLAPKLMYEANVPSILAAITPHFESPVTMLDTGELPADEIQHVLDRLERRARAKAHDLIALKEYYGGFIADQPAKLFIESLDIDPDDHNAQYYLKQIALSRAEFEIGGREPARAIAILEEALRYAPNEPELHVMLGDVYFDQQQPEQARDQYRRYLELGGTLPRARDRAE